MKIAIIGAGNVGQTLGTALRSKGHTVIYGARDPASHTERNVRSVAEALIGAEVVILATPWIATEALVVQHADGLAGKIVIDATNPDPPGSRAARRRVQQLGRRAAAKPSPPGEVLQGVQQHRRERDGSAALRRRQGRDVRRRSRRRR